MYNKLFTKILDSSIWLEAPETRLVWVTMLAAMDRDGFVQMASVKNLAHRANVPVEDCQRAVTVLESPDENDPDCPFQGRRIERVPKGWMVLKASEYRDLVTREEAREMNRLRVQNHRERKRKEAGQGNVPVRTGNADVMAGNASVMQSETEAETRSEKRTPPPQVVPPAARPDIALPVSEKDIERKRLWDEILSAVTIPEHRVREHLKPCLLRDIRQQGEVTVLEVNCGSSKSMRWIADNYIQQLTEAAQAVRPGGKFKFQFVVKPLSARVA